MITLLGLGRGTRRLWDKGSAGPGEHQTQRKYLSGRVSGIEEEGLSRGVAHIIRDVSAVGK